MRLAKLTASYFCRAAASVQNENLVQAALGSAYVGERGNGSLAPCRIADIDVQTS